MRERKHNDGRKEAKKEKERKRKKRKHNDRRKERKKKEQRKNEERGVGMKEEREIKE